MSAIRRKVFTAKSALNDIGAGSVDTQGSTLLCLYVKSGAGVSSGAVQLEGSATGSLAAEPSQGDWVAIGTPLTVGAAGTTVRTTASEAHRFVRARISTAIVGGTVDAYIICGGPNLGSWEDV